MSVYYKKENNKLILELDNEELVEYEKIINKWLFRDHQSLMKFFINLLTPTENKRFRFKLVNGLSYTEVEDVDDAEMALLIKKDSDGEYITLEDAVKKAAEIYILNKKSNFKKRELYG